MKRKKFIQACEAGGSIYGKNGAGKNVSPIHKNVCEKDLINVYNKFYKNQVTALYEAIRKGT